MTKSNPALTEVPKWSFKAASETKQEQKQKELDEAAKELHELVGLSSVKYEVSSLLNLARMRGLRLNKGFPIAPMSLHLAFTGNPGTGKTTVARLLGRIYKNLGVLDKGHVIEVDRSGLVAGYVGQTALKIKEALTNALGGILFIDEAYSLASREHSDFGHEAIETLMKGMEDHRDQLVVIVAGYPAPMQQFISSNPGLQSRFHKLIDFPDYSQNELYTIYQTCVTAQAMYAPTRPRK